MAAGVRGISPAGQVVQQKAPIIEFWTGSAPLILPTSLGATNERYLMLIPRTRLLVVLSIAWAVRLAPPRHSHRSIDFTAQYSKRRPRCNDQIRLPVKAVWHSYWHKKTNTHVLPDPFWQHPQCCQGLVYRAQPVMRPSIPMFPQHKMIWHSREPSPSAAALGNFVFFRYFFSACSVSGRSRAEVPRRCVCE